MSGAYGYFPEGASVSPPPSHSVPISPLPSFHGSHMTANSTVAANWDTTGYGAMIQVQYTVQAGGGEVGEGGEETEGG